MNACPKNLRVGYLTTTDPHDRRSWSGTHYYMARALEQYCGEVHLLGPLGAVYTKLGQAVRDGVERVSGRRYLYAQTTSFARTMGRIAGSKLSRHDCEVIFAPAGSAVIAYLDTNKPIVYLSDATLRVMIDYYTEFSNVLSSHIKMADELESRAIERATHLVYPSSWAAESAIRDYGADPAKITVIPFGANLDHAPPRHQALQMPPWDCCRLLFVGVNWVRKGGEIAFDTLLELDRLGVPAQLTIVGCRPPRNIAHRNLRVFEFLDKNDAGQRATLLKLYQESTFFILPTRAECFSVSLCEANAYGLPILSSYTGGLSELVYDGVNGFLFRLKSKGDEYAAKIAEFYTAPEKYQALRLSSRNEFESRLNWDTWGKRMSEILSRVAQGVRNGPALQLV